MKIKELPNIKFENKECEKQYLQLTKLIYALSNLDNLSDSVRLSANRVIDNIKHHAAQEEMIRNISRNAIKTICRVLIVEQKVHPKQYFLKLMCFIGFVTIALPAAIIAWFVSHDVTTVIISLVAGFIVGILIGLYRDLRCKMKGKQLNIKSPL
ncbi:MAG: hypothetical protein ACK5MI_07680 [Mangrovibacterium sp.]